MHCCPPAGGTAGSFRYLVRSTFAVFVGVALFGLANGGLFPVIGVRLSAGGASDILIGVITSAYFLGTLSGSLTAGRIVDRVRHIRSFAVAAALAAITTLALAHTSSLPVWAVLRFATGYCMGAYYVVVESWVNCAATNANRGRSLAIYESVRMSAIALSPFLLNLDTDSQAFALASMLFVAAIVPVALAGTGEPEIGGSGRLPFRKLLTASPLGALCCVTAGLVSSAFYGLGAVYGNKIGLSGVQLSLFVSVTWIAPLAFQFPAGALADHIDRRWVIFGASALSASAAVLIAGIGGKPLLLLLCLSFLMGGLSHPIYALGLAYTNDRLDHRDYVRAGGAMLVAYGIGTSAGSAMASLAMTAFGASGLYLFIAGALSTVAAATLFALSKRETRT